MAIDDLQTWKDEGDYTPEGNPPPPVPPNALGPENNQADGVQNLANWMAERVDDKMEFSAPVVCATTYTFGKAAFIAALSSISNAGSISAGANTLADAWEAGVNSGTMVPSEAGYVGSPAPPTQWAAPPTAVILPSSVTSAKSSLVAALIAMGNVGDFQDSGLSAAFRDAFLALQFTLSGNNTQPPPTGPLPLSTVASVE